MGVYKDYTYSYSLVSESYQGIEQEISKLTISVILNDDKDDVSINKFFLSEAYPNPFNNSCRFKIHIPTVEKNNLTQYKINIFSLSGEKISSLWNGPLQEGKYVFYWDGKNSNNIPVGSGQYLLTVTANNLYQVRKLILLK